MNIVLATLTAITLNCSEIENKLPEPKPQEAELALEEIIKQAKGEIFSLSTGDIAEFMWNRYVKGDSVDFHEYGANPKSLTPIAALMPATILVHSSASNQGQWSSLLKSFEKVGNLGPVFTLNYEDGDELASLKQKILEVKALYSSAGVDVVNINLVGQSLGGIAAAEYAFSPEMWVVGTHVAKVITIAARLKNIANPIDTPFYAYAFPTLKHIESVFQRIEQNRALVELYTIAAANDWLVPAESSLVAADEAHKAVVPEVGHVLVAQSIITNDLVIKFIR